ncbi:hypothetical protein [Qaidamihabitans albus]|uniref:hypothetical protein n=1 Tax=Qaidamihabitans albus TaxID=2795733 RepID=UPI0018F200EC|nr:hypothetical protein [Qaidamihabitans albus]
MTIIRITRFGAAPSVDTDALLARRTALISTIRASYSGLLDTRLTRAEDGTWVDIWHWDSADSAMTVAQAGLPEAAAAFAVTTNATVEQAEIIDEDRGKP